MVATGKAVTNKPLRQSDGHVHDPQDGDQYPNFEGCKGLYFFLKRNQSVTVTVDCRSCLADDDGTPAMWPAGSVRMDWN